MPLTLNPAPEDVTPEMVTLEFPELVRVTDDEPVLPRLTFPKLRDEGFGDSR